MGFEDFIGNQNTVELLRGMLARNEMRDGFSITALLWVLLA